MANIAASSSEAVKSCDLSTLRAPQVAKAEFLNSLLAVRLAFLLLT